MKVMHALALFFSSLFFQKENILEIHLRGEKVTRSYRNKSISRNLTTDIEKDKMCHISVAIFQWEV